MARILVNKGQWQAALEVFETIEKSLSRDRETFDKFFAADLDRALALLGVGRAGKASKEAETAHSRNRRNLGEKHYDTAEAGAIHAISLLRLGRLAAALGAFRKAIPILLSRSRQSDGETTTRAAREQRLTIILDAYIALLDQIRGDAIETAAGIDAVAEAFRIADVARGRSVQNALVGCSARAAARNPALAEQVRREQDAEKQIAALYGLLANLLSAPTDARNPDTVRDLRLRIDRLRGARAALAGEIAKRFPDFANLVRPAPTTIEQARAALGPEEALIATYVGRDRTYVWAIPHSGRMAFAAADVGREGLADIVGLLRAALEPNATTLGDIPDFDLGAGLDLYQRLLKPVAAGWIDAKSLLMVAHGPLGYLPMALLPTAAAPRDAPGRELFAKFRRIPWLVRTHAVTVLPSVASLKALRSLPPGDAGRRAFAGFGDPWFSQAHADAAAGPAKEGAAAVAERGVATRGLAVSLRAAPRTAELDSAELARLPRLADTAAEIRAMASAMNADPSVSVFLGKEATEDPVKSMDLSAVRVLAFATHGLVPGDLNGLTQPALALSSPEVAGGKEDGLLTMGEILGLRLNADWAVLSACNTGTGAGAGAEAVSGLGRAFFYAGTRALLVSNWPVETTSAKALTTDIFRRQAGDPGLSRAQALRQSMLSLIDGEGFTDAFEKTVFSYAHPIFWAPFSLVGDPGGGRPGLN